MFNRTTVSYVYDGSFDGLLCCVFESFSQKELPFSILPEEKAEGLLFPQRFIPTDPQKAERVLMAIPKKLGGGALELVQTGFLFDGSEKEEAILQFLIFAFRTGPKAVDMTGTAAVDRLFRMARAVRNDQHLSLEFLRFADYSGGLVAVIEPKHQILPLLQNHFTSRFPEERFMIWDKAHGMALVYRPYAPRIIQADEVELPEETAEEAAWQLLWKRYYDAIAVSSRINPKCRMTHMPKRFWNHMPELNGQPGRLHAASAPVLASASRQIS